MAGNKAESHLQRWSVPQDTMIGFELRHLQYFLAVAEERNFGRAARRLGIAQPPLSQQIQKLERILGAQLFDRAQRPIELTPAGRVLLAETRHVLAHAVQAEQAVRRVATGDRGELNIGFVTSVSHQILPLVLRLYRAQHRDVRIVLHDLTTAEQAEALSAGRLDVGFLRPPVGGDLLETEPVLEEPLVAILPAGHPMATDQSIALPSLKTEPFILVDRDLSPGTHYHCVRACLNAGFSPRVVQEGANLSSVAGLVAAGLGVGLVPASFLHLQVAGVVDRPLQDPAPMVTIEVAWLRGMTSHTLDGFVSAIRNVARMLKARGTHR